MVSLIGLALDLLCCNNHKDLVCDFPSDNNMMNSLTSCEQHLNVSSFTGYKYTYTLK